MSCLGETPSEMTNVTLGPGEKLSLEIVNAINFRNRCPEQFHALIECVMDVNERQREMGYSPVLSLLFV